MFTFWKKKQINLSKQKVTELTILENKKWFSIKFFIFHKSCGDQGRFHTHSFKSISFRLWGNYIEEIISNGRIVKRHRNHSRFMYIPPNQYHQITYSDGCATILITGPWSETYNELRDIGYGIYEKYICGRHRVDVAKVGRFKLKDIN